MKRGQRQPRAIPLTPFYASPEQIRGEPLTVATDIYSLGVLLYQLLSQQHPYGRRQGTAAAFKAILEEAPIPLRQQTHGIPSDLENIVMTALRKEHERRYATVDALADDIRNFLDGFPVKAAPDTFIYRFSKFTAAKPLGGCGRRRRSAGSNRLRDRCLARETASRHALPAGKTSGALGGI